MKIDDNGLEATVTSQNIGNLINTIKITIEKTVRRGPVHVLVTREKKSRSQEEKYHAMIGDISKTVYVNGNQYSLDVWKAKLVDDFEKEYKLSMGEGLRHGGQWTMSLCGNYPVRIRASTAKFLKLEACRFIMYLHMKGAEFGATFSDESMAYYEEAAQYVKSKQNP